MELFSPFLPILIDSYHSEHQKYVNSPIEELVPTRKSQPNLPNKIEQAISSPVHEEEPAVLPETVPAPVEPALSLQEQFFRNFTRIPSSLLSKDPSQLAAFAVPLQHMYHFLLYSLSEDILKKKSSSNLRENSSSASQIEALFSCARYASHMFMEQGFFRLRQLKDLEMIFSHNLLELSSRLKVSPSLREYVRAFPLDNIAVRYPYNDRSHTEIVPDSYSDALLKAQDHFEKGAFPLIEELQQCYPSLTLNFHALSDEKVQVDQEIGKKTKSLLLLFSRVLLTLKNLSVNLDENEIKNCLQHLKRLEGFLKLLSEEASQKNYLLFTHQITSAMQHSFELILLVCAKHAGFPLVTHNLESYLTFLGYFEKKILSHAEIQSLLRFNTKKSLDYPINALCQYKVKNAKSLWSAFVTSFQACSAGEGFMYTKKENITSKYLTLLRNTDEGLLVLEKIIKSMPSMNIEARQPQNGSFSL